MKNRILTGWTFMRLLYVIIGTVVIVQSIMEKQWLGLLFGIYFASMGVFAYGCAAGNCNTSNQKNNSSSIQDVDFEEIK